MRKSFDKLLVVDVEATCWESGKPPYGQFSEIIEIGVCPIDLANLQIGESISILVCPKFSTVSQFCTSLTSLTPQDVEKGTSFKAACDRLKVLGANTCTWGSWGDHDRKQFWKQCSNKKHFHAAYPFGQTHVNIKNLSSLCMRMKKEVGMDKALQMINLELDGTHHRGMDDAKNIAKIRCYLLKNARSTLV